jgi:peptide/nickel transport system substrate-binding protein
MLAKRNEQQLMMRWRINPYQILGTIVLAVVFLSGCQPDRADRSLPMEDGVHMVRVLYAGANEDIFSPTWDDTPKFLIFEPLVTYEANTCSDIVGGLAARWEHSPDWKTWTIELRPDVRWHDGMPVTSADVAFTVALWKHPDVLHYSAWSIDFIEIIDPLHFRVHLKKPGDWPLDGWPVVYPEHLLKDLDPAGFYDWKFWIQPVGNGPFRYVRHVADTMVELEANPDYYLGRPSLERVRIQFKVGGQNQTGLIELLAGNVDMVDDLSPIQAAILDEEPGLNAYYVYQASSVWLIWNFTDPHFSDLRVRRALAHATDREELRRILGFPDDLPITDGIYFMCDPGNIQVAEPYAYDPDYARKLLAEAGWWDNDGDGMLDKDGEPFAFTLLLSRESLMAAVFVQDQLRLIGIDMKIQVLDRSVVITRFRAGDFESIIAKIVGSERSVVSKTSPLGLLDQELAEAVDAAMTEPDLSRKLQLFESAGEQYRKLAPALSLHPIMTVLIADERLIGIGKPGAITRRMSWRHKFGGLQHLQVKTKEDE